MITAVYILKTSYKQSNDLLEVLKSIIGRTQSSPGCLKADIWSNYEDPESFMVYEVWKTKEIMELHLKSKVFRRMIAVMEMSSIEPEIKFIESDHQYGMEWLQGVLTA